MATLEQIQARMKKLQAQAEALLARQAQAAVDQIRSIMLKHGLTTTDIEARAKARREGRGTTVAPVVKAIAQVARANGKMPPKYRDPRTGATWSGHARPPAWIKDVKDRTKFLIGDAAESIGAGKAKRAAKGKASASRSAAKPATDTHRAKQPPKYRDPKSGATWSGRGPAPAWLAGAKDRSTFLIGAVSGASRPAKKAVASKKATMDRKSSTARKAVSTTASGKKTAVASKRPASKKATSAKTPPARKAVKRAARVIASGAGADHAASPLDSTVQASAT